MNAATAALLRLLRRERPGFAPFDRFVIDQLGASSQAREVREAIALVGASQPVPTACPSVRVGFESDLGHHDGYYNGGTRPEILLDPASDALRETLVHEVAHYLDDVLCRESEGEGSWSDEPDFLSWLGVAAASEHVRQWLEIRRQVWSTVVFTTSGESIRDWADYLLLPEELWARSYVQFFAMLSGDERLSQSVKRSAPPSEPAYPLYWTASDFAPIGQAISWVLANRTTLHSGH